MEERNMCRSDSRETLLWFAIAGMQVGICAGIAVAVHLISGAVFPFPIPWFWCSLLGTAAWTVIFFFARGVNAFTVNVADFHGCVLSNRLLKIKRPKTDEDRLFLKPSRALEEIGQGVHPRWPWQRPTFIDLRKQITVKRTVTTFSKDNIEVSLDWLMINAALRGYLCFLVQNTEGEAQDILEAKVNSKLTVKLNTLTVDQIIEKMDELTGWFGITFDGDDKSSVIEKQCGLSARELTLNAFRRSKKYQESAESLAKADNTAKAVAKLVSAGSTLKNPITGKQALQFVAASEGVADLSIYDISGLENLQYMGAGLPFPMEQKKEKK